MSFLFDNFQNVSGPKNNQDYDYWEGSFKGYSPKKLLALSDEELQGLFNEFVDKGLQLDYLDRYYNKYKKYISSKKNISPPEVTDFKEELRTKEGGSFLRYILSKIMEGIKYTKNGEIEIFRIIFVNQTEEINFEELGICWTYKYNNIPYLERIFDFYKGGNAYKIRFAGATPQDNIDWVNSLYLYLEHAFLDGNEDELRVIDPKKIYLNGYISMDSRSNVLYSQYGDVSKISKGVITK